MLWQDRPRLIEFHVGDVITVEMRRRVFHDSLDDSEHILQRASKMHRNIQQHPCHYRSQRASRDRSGAVKFKLEATICLTLVVGLERFWA